MTMPRAPMLNVAFLGESPPAVSDFLQPSAWQQVEAAYGHEIPASARTEITEATQKLIEFSAFALAAEPISLSLDRAEAIRHGAASLLEVLSSQSDSTQTVDGLIDRQLASLIAAPHTLGSIGDALSCLIAASERSKKELKHRIPTELRADEHWKHWVRRITCTIEKCALPTKVRKDRNGNPKWKPSPFVLLIDSIQERLPLDYRRTRRKESVSKEPLSQAILSARQEFRRPAKSGK
jgi:hypothetical protein